MGERDEKRLAKRVRRALWRWGMRALLGLGRRATVDVPAGHVAVCVGSSGRRFVVRVAYLNHPMFQMILLEAEQAYGFPAACGPLSVPCDESRFEEILHQISSSFPNTGLAKLNSSSLLRVVPQEASPRATGRVHLCLE